jgi:hypothetical protein
LGCFGSNARAHHFLVNATNCRLALRFSWILRILRFFKLDRLQTNLRPIFSKQDQPCLLFGNSMFGSLLKVLLLILSNFFTLRSEPLAQHQLQMWYFHFQAVCILFLPIVGSDFRNFAKQILQDSSPSSVLKLLADRTLVGSC